MRPPWLNRSGATTFDDADVAHVRTDDSWAVGVFYASEGRAWRGFKAFMTHRLRGSD